jgi:flagellar motor protein MotB
MKFRTTLLLYLLSFSLANAQNLVLNGSFEETKKCPKATGFNFKKLKGQIKTINGSPDYYNSCGSYSVNIPYNITGYQEAYNGSAYCGLVLTTQALSECEAREFIQLKLTEPLINGYKYDVSFFINLANTSGYYTDQVGIYFSNIDLSKKKTIKPYLGKQQINNTTNNFLNDTVNWTEISSTYNAKGNENYIVIGNFQACNRTSRKALISNKKEGVLTNLKNKNEGIIKAQMGGSKNEKNKHSSLIKMNDLAYYLIDNVSVTPIGKNKKIASLTKELACTSLQKITSNNLIIDGEFNLNKTENIAWKNASEGTPDFLKNSVGLYLYSEINKNNREYIISSLKENLSPCSQYYFEMKVKRNSAYKYSADQIGIALVDSFTAQPGRDVFSLEPAYHSPQFHLINNTENWITLCGSITPKSCSSSIIIGNFNTDDKTFIYSSEDSGSGPFAYYFIDDVKLFKIDTNKNCISPCFKAIVNIDNDTTEAKAISFKPVSIQYKTAATTPQLTSNKWVQNLKNSIEKNPLSIILIEGHTDNVGSEQSNKTLSKLRAQKIYTLLINEGISEKNIKYKYFGSSRPKANNLTAKNRKLNRRVEITILQ